MRRLAVFFFSVGLAGCLWSGGPTQEQVELRDEIHAGAVAAMGELEFPEEWEIADTYEVVGAVSTEANQNNPGPGILRVFVDVHDDGISKLQLAETAELVGITSGGQVIMYKDSRQRCSDTTIISFLMIDGYNITIRSNTVEHARDKRSNQESRLTYEINYLADRKTTLDPSQYPPTDLPLVCEDE